MIVHLRNVLCAVLDYQVTESTDFDELPDNEPWLNSTRLVVKPDMLFGKRGKSGLVSIFWVQIYDLVEVNFFLLTPI